MLLELYSDDGRNNNGVTSYLDVVISEQEELATQITQNNLQGLRFVSTIQLIKVIGGGWDCIQSHSAISRN